MSNSSPTSTFWLTLPNLKDLDILEATLITASHLTVEDVYEFAEGPESLTLLGKGINHYFRF
jgi:hypothetical protein